MAIENNKSLRRREWWRGRKLKIWFVLKHFRHEIIFAEKMVECIISCKQMQISFDTATAGCLRFWYWLMSSAGQKLIESRCNLLHQTIGSVCIGTKVAVVFVGCHYSAFFCLRRTVFSVFWNHMPLGDICL